MKIGNIYFKGRNLMAAIPYYEQAIALDKLLALKKTEIAYQIANAIDEDLAKEVRTILNVDDTNDTVNYLVKAIKYATSN